MRQFAEKWANFAKNKGKIGKTSFQRTIFRNEYFILHTLTSHYFLFMSSAEPLFCGERHERSEYCEENVTFV